MDAEIQMRRIGILGGMGPLATDFFLRLLLRDICATLQPTRDQHFPDMTILMESSMPDRSAEIKGGNRLAAQRINRLIAELAENGCNPIVIPCVTAHSLVEPKWFDSAVLDIRDCIVKHTAGRGPACVGILATDGSIRSGVFAPLADKFDLVFPDRSAQEKVMSVVYRKNGLKSFSTDVRACQEGLEEVMAHLRAKGAECMVLGCTEIEMFLTNQQVAGDYLLPMGNMSREIVRMLQAEADTGI